jgi:hypothetical protein
LIKIVGSKKGLPFHSVILSLAVIGLRSVKDEVRKVAHFELLVFFISFLGSLLEISVPPFLKFNIPFKCYDALSESTRINVLGFLCLVPWILLFSRFNSPFAFRVKY